MANLQKKARAFWIIFLFLWIPFGKQAFLPFEGKLFDRVEFQRVGGRALHPSLAVVGVDSESLEKAPHPWPWPRREIAELIELLVSAGARGVVVDFLFYSGKVQEGDEILSDTLKKIPSVILMEITGGRLFKPLPPIGEGDRLWAVSQGKMDGDHLLRRLRSSVLLGNRIFPSLGLAGGLISQHQDPRKVDLKPYLSYGGWGEGEVPFPPGLDFSSSKFSFVSVKSGKIDKKVFKDRVVFVGATAPSLHDFFNTSRGIQSGVEIQASFAHGFLRKELPKKIPFLDLGLFQGVFILAWVEFFLRYPLTSLWPLLLVHLGLIFFSLLTHLFGGLVGPHFFPIFSLLTLSPWVFFLRQAARGFEEARIRGELDAAAEIQGTLLPTLSPDLPGYLIFGKTQSADSVGGDYFDLLDLPSGEKVLLLGDVSGHGIPACLAMALAKAAAVLSCEKTAGLETLFRSVNHLFFTAMKRKKMITLWGGVLDPVGHTLEYSNAGHSLPILISSGKGGEYLGNPKGSYPLGVKKKCQPHLEKIFLNPGDTLLVYTDGLVEAANEKGEMLGFEPFLAIALKNSHSDPKVMAEGILKDISHFRQGTPASDDSTLLILTRRPNDPP